MRELNEQDLGQVAGGITVSESSHVEIRSGKNAVVGIYHSLLPYLNMTVRDAMAGSPYQIYRQFRFAPKFSSTLQAHS